MTENSKPDERPTYDKAQNPCGSIWHRWDPHIHAPGTLHNDQFKGARADEKFIEQINASKPPIRVLGITDYYIFDSYERALNWHHDGKLPNVAFIFPNIELRLTVSAGKGSPINAHLLISPEDSDHVAKGEKFLNELDFIYQGETYRCTRKDLIQLGWAYKSDCSDDKHALRIGAEQFKVDPDDLITAYGNSEWAKQNILIAISASSNDGTAQLQADSGLAATRKKLEHAAHIIFSSREGDREFWLGHTDKLSPQKLIDDYGGPKPCLHGSDAHDNESVGKPALDRFSWLKGDLNFETLRQACLEPEWRAFVGQHPPEGGSPSNTIVELSVSKTDWIAEPVIPINPGLVAIIGARGSGKTALVELIAAGANSIQRRQSKGSFLDRASERLGQEISSLAWAGGGPTSSGVQIDDLPDEPDYPRVRYLSQQFVDRLCSSEGLAIELVEEIERIIFQAHTPETRYGASTFEELRESVTAAPRHSKEGFKSLISEIASQLAVQHDLDRSLDQLRKKRIELLASIERDKDDRKKLTPSDNKQVLARLDAIREAAEAKAQEIALLNKRDLDLVGLKQEADQFRNFEADANLDHLKFNYPASGLKDSDWELFKLNFKGNVDELLKERLGSVQKEIKAKKGPSKDEVQETDDPAKASPYVAENVELSELTLSILQKEQRRLEAKIGIDKARRKKYTDLSTKITKAEASLKKLEAEIAEAESADKKIKILRERREEAYGNIFREIVKEEELLRKLYGPLDHRLKAQTGAINKLTFSVRREVNLEGWTETGERMLDVRKAGKFRGIGTLHQIAEKELLEVWQSGASDKIAEAMSIFRNTYGPEFGNTFLIMLIAHAKRGSRGLTMFLNGF